MSDPLRVVVGEPDDDGQVSVSVQPAESGPVRATPLTGFLQLTNPTVAEQDKLKAVWDYVTDTTDSELDSERLWAIRAMEQKLAAPRLGQTRLDQLYQYVTIEQQAQSAEKLRDSLLR